MNLGKSSDVLSHALRPSLCTVDRFKVGEADSPLSGERNATIAFFLQSMLRLCEEPLDYPSVSRPPCDGRAGHCAPQHWHLLNQAGTV